MRSPPGTRTTQGDSTPNSSLSPTRPGSTATPTCCHGAPGGCTASMIRPVVPSWPEYHMRSVPSGSSRTQGLLARTLSGSPEDPGEKTSPSRVHSTVRTSLSAPSRNYGDVRTHLHPRSRRCSSLAYLPGTRRSSRLALGAQDALSASSYFRSGALSVPTSRSWVVCVPLSLAHNRAPALAQRRQGCVPGVDVAQDAHPPTCQRLRHAGANVRLVAHVDQSFLDHRLSSF